MSNKKKNISKSKSKPTSSDIEIKNEIEVTETSIKKENVKKKEPVVPEVDTTDETKIVEEIVKTTSRDNSPIYQVRLEFDDISTQKQSFTNVNKAIIECNKYPGYKVFNESGTPIHISTAPLKLSNTRSVEYAGKRYKLNEAKLYASAIIKTPKAVVSGDYYLYDGIRMNDRYRIVDKKSKANGNIKDVVGYVRVEHM